MESYYFDWWEKTKKANTQQTASELQILTVNYLRYELSELSFGIKLLDARGQTSLIRTDLYYFQAVLPIHFLAL